MAAFQPADPFLPMAIKAQQQSPGGSAAGAVHRRHFLAVETEQMLKARQLFHATTSCVVFWPALS